MSRTCCEIVRAPVALGLALSLVACGGDGGGMASAISDTTGHDRSAPSVEILDPTTAPEFVTDSDTLTLNGTASDDRELASVRWSTNRGTAGTAVGLDRWQVQAIPLMPGRTVIRVVASDTDGEESSDVLSVIRESSDNAAPSIGGAPPAEVLKGESYEFRPIAGDEDGDVLRFSIANRPVWAIFDERTGQLSGRPGRADVGRHEGIVIGVSDGQLAAQLPPFSIDVLDGGQFSITLTWAAPTRRTDGSPLTDLGGYQIYYGTDALDHRVHIDNPGVTTWTLGGLRTGRYRVAMTAIDVNGVEGRRSEAIEVQVGDLG